MPEIKKTNPELWSWLLSMINAIDREIGLKEEDKVLTLVLLHNDMKIEAVCDLVKKNSTEGKLNATPAEVMQALSQIAVM